VGNGATTICGSTITLGGVSGTGFVPVGAVFYFSRVTAPSGYLKANGNTVPNGVGTVQGVTTDFSALYAILGSTYGAAGRLPDLRGQFVRGFVDGGTVDSGRAFGSIQTDAFQGHRHSANGPSGTPGSPYTVPQLGSNLQAGTSVVFAVNTETDGVNGTPRSAAETRPTNIALLACIKY
jgi:microcystin-dependent protein